ncbi:MAG TPA: hypothetical protein V6C81_12300 [Planktothrix sp.]|jgi:hypothetical protein
MKMKNTRILLAVLIFGILGLGTFMWDAGRHATAQPQPVATAQPAQPTAKADPGTDGTNPPTQTSSDPCSTTTATTGTNSTSGSGFPDDGFDFDPSDNAQTPTPANPVMKTCEAGRIKMMVGATREFGNRIGDKVNIQIRILTDDGVLIDWTSLKQKVLGFDGSDFVLAADDSVTVQSAKKDHQVLYVINMTVQTFVPKDPGTTFNLDLRYATGLAADSKTPDWQVLTTPDFFVTRSATVDNGSDLQEGSVDAAQSGTPWLMWPVLVAGFFLLFLWPGYAVVRYLNRIRPGRVVPANEIAWRKLDKTFADAKEFGWETRHYKAVASALRVYLGVAPNTRLEILDRLADHKQIETIKSALTKCDRVLYGQERLSGEETRELVRQINALVPRPA